MNTVLDELPTIPTCKTELIAAADHYIGRNHHRLYHNPDRKDGSNPIIDGIILYADRTAQLQIQAQPEDCHIRISEHYVLNDPCSVGREEIFRKWQYRGKLDEHSIMLDNPRKPYLQTALLSEGITMKIACIISVESEIPPNLNPEEPSESH
ncbi:MAG: hypothetical protein Q4A74_06120 [Cardiobacteriaceae bacterium]|nr:hypothetical protein [Cardiobacteriaceae bacterium]